MLSAVIVEDEILASERLRILLESCNIILLKTFTHANYALTWLEEHETDIVFVDIGLPEINGLEFVEILRRKACKLPAIIFTTAYEEHALKAFELAAVDYLLKPIKISRLKEAIDRISSAKNSDSTNLNYFAINCRDRIIKIAYHKVAYLMADQKTVWLYTFDGECFELTKTLLHWEKILMDKVLRIHRNALVMTHALDFIVQLADDNDGNAHWGAKIKGLDITLPISRRQLSTIRKNYY